MPACRLLSICLTFTSYHVLQRTRHLREAHASLGARRGKRKRQTWVSHNEEIPLWHLRRSTSHQPHLSTVQESAHSTQQSREVVEDVGSVETRKERKSSEETASLKEETMGIEREYMGTRGF